MDESSEKKPDPLVVEDSSTQAEHLKYILEKHGYEVAVAKNGKEAIDYLNTNLPSIIISDVVMPEMDGFELCKRVKGDEKLGKIPFVILTTLSDLEDGFCPDCLEGISAKK